MRHKKDKRFSSIIGIFLILLVIGIISSPALSDNKEKDQSVSFSLKDQDGNTVNLSDYIGKVVVLEWVNPDCPFTKRHYSDKYKTAIKLYNKYHQKGVIYIGINSTNYFDQGKNKQWHDSFNLPFSILDDHDGTVGKQFKARSTPHVFVIDKTGKIAYQGAIDNDSYGDKESKDIVNYVDVVVNDLISGKAPSITETTPYGCSVKYAK